MSPAPLADHTTLVGNSAALVVSERLSQQVKADSIPPKFQVYAVLWNSNK